MAERPLQETNPKGFAPALRVNRKAVYTVAINPIGIYAGNNGILPKAKTAPDTQTRSVCAGTDDASVA